MFFRVVLIDNLTDKLFEAVFESDEPGNVAVLISNDRNVKLAVLHLTHQPGNGLIFRNERHISRKVEYRKVTAALALCAHQVFREGETHDVILVTA